MRGLGGAAERAGAARDHQRRRPGTMPLLRALARGRGASRSSPTAAMAALGSARVARADRVSRRRARARRRRRGRPTIVLDRLQDPGNVGSVLRSAAAFGFTQVLALKGTAALWSPKVVRAGMGAHSACSWSRRPTTPRSTRSRCRSSAPARTPASDRRASAAMAVRLGVRPRRAGRRAGAGGALRRDARDSAARRRGVAQRRRAAGASAATTSAPARAGPLTARRRCA